MDARREEWLKRINPRKLGYSPRMAAIVGAIVGYDYGARHPVAGMMRAIHITSDGYVMGDCTGHESGAFLGDVADFERNLDLYRSDLSEEDRARFDSICAAAVDDWRPLKDATVITAEGTSKLKGR